MIWARRINWFIQLEPGVRKLNLTSHRNEYCCRGRRGMEPAAVWKFFNRLIYKEMAHPTGFEPVTPAFGGQYRLNGLIGLNLYNLM